MRGSRLACFLQVPRKVVKHISFIFDSQALRHDGMRGSPVATMVAANWQACIECAIECSNETIVI